MATATYADFTVLYPDSTASQETVEAHLKRVAAEIAARCEERGTTYETLVEKRRDVVVGIECEVANRRCGRPAVDGSPQNGLQSFSQTVGDHKWELNYGSGNGNTSVLRDEWKALGLYGQQVGWLGVPWGPCDD